MTTFTQIVESNQFLIYVILLITVFEATGQLCLKQYESNNSYLYFVLGILFYTFVCGLLCYCYKHKGQLGRVNLMWSCMSIIFVIIVGYVFLQEKIKLHDFAAILFALLAIYFANMN